MSDDTPNGAGEPQAANTEGVSQNAVNPAGQETEPANEPTGEAISPQEFQELKTVEKQTESPKTADAQAKTAHNAKMMIAQARVEKVAREQGISKSEAAVELLDGGSLKQDEANYLFKRFGETEVATPNAPQALEPNRLKQEIRAEDKLYEVVKGANMSKQDAKMLMEDYQRLSQKGEPDEAADFAIFRSGVTVKQGEQAGYTQAQSDFRKMQAPHGSSPSTPQPANPPDTQSLEEQEDQDAIDIKAVQQMKEKEGYRG